MIIDQMEHEGDANPSTKKSYLNTLITSTANLAPNASTDMSTLGLLLHDELDAPADSSNFIPISLEEKNRIYQPWTHAIIVKVYGRKVAHQVLRQKIYTIWQPTENLPLIDLGSDFFLLKFQKEENKNHALHDGPWFIFNHFLSVRQWEPKFMASETKINFSAIWLRLPKLPTEFYDFQILQKVGNNIGKLLTVDTCTSSTTRGRCARLYVEIPVDQPLRTHIYLGMHGKISYTKD
ncbi:uncharacterized protein LOC142165918 [Nicotiana tabacum]|uniref:Uncharacterized protein LOC142165918 n=2 Tax=Nicotiana TaxID=4085 RepID=A0AC58S600_TOBAC|nr:PREDICTED: uncharacterized protein LOC104242361 [Nicotiana sylvestris]